MLCPLYDCAAPIRWMIEVSRLQLLFVLLLSLQLLLFVTIHAAPEEQFNPVEPHITGSFTNHNVCPTAGLALLSLPHSRSVDPNLFQDGAVLRERGDDQRRKVRHPDGTLSKSTSPPFNCQNSAKVS